VESYTIGVDLGGTNLKAAAISQDGLLIDKLSGGTNLKAGRDAVVQDMVETIWSLRERCGSAPLRGVGIGVPGIIEMRTGVIAMAPNLPGFENFPIRDEIERRLKAPVILENDANVAALGEKWMGAGLGVDSLVLLTLGTGIGGGIIYQGKIMHGAIGMAGELGHIKVVPDGNPCGCGANGCLEKHASAMVAGAMARMMGLGDDLSAKDVFDLAMGGEPRAKVIFETVGKALGVALADLVNIFNFPLYLLSGGMLPAWEFFAPAMFEEVRRSSYVYRCSETRIERATLGDEAGLYGAAFLPLEQ
jgi:glucokinase